MDAGSKALVCILTCVSGALSSALDRNSTDRSSYWQLLMDSPKTFRFPQSVELTVAAEEWVPHITVQGGPESEVILQGPMANLLKALAQSINFRYKVTRPPDGAWGIPRKDGSEDWTGMIGMVKRHEADLALGPFGLTASRSKVVSFSNPILIDYYRILVRRQKPQPDAWGWRRPFTAVVWLCFALCMGGLTLLLWLNTRLFGIQVTTDAREPRRDVGVFEHFWVIFAVAISQPCKWTPHTWAGRTLMAVWFLMALISMRSYSSSLTSLLAVRTVATPYNFLIDLVEDQDVRLVFEASTAFVEQLLTVKTGIYASLAAEKARSRFVTPTELYKAAYTDVKNSKTALLVEDTTCNKVISDDYTKLGRCDFYVGKERYFPLVFSMIGRKDHPIMQAINSRLDHMLSHDLYFKWLSYELPNASACSNAASSVTVREPYSLRGLWGVFILLVVGLILSLLCLCAEACIHARHTRHAPQHTRHTPQHARHTQRARHTRVT
ncbi:Ionotropic glutamate receptor [Trinorchestia longiramus]|nr:Ionotropic glutamate receptor [Trinorchestia longiramus]